MQLSAGTSHAHSPLPLTPQRTPRHQVVHKAALLPPLRDGDWLMFPAAGAYTICAASNYGGVAFTQPRKLWVYSADAHRWVLVWRAVLCCAVSWELCCVLGTLLCAVPTLACLVSLLLRVVIVETHTNTRPPNHAQGHAWL
jgi:hypothetical protein